jgi:integrase
MPSSVGCAIERVLRSGHHWLAGSLRHSLEVPGPRVCAVWWLGNYRTSRSGKVVRDDAGEPIRLPKYSGLHALRHFFASWCINRKTDGGLELPAKVVQDRLGHSTIVMTLDRYGHLFPPGDDTAGLAAAERILLG